MLATNNQRLKTNNVEIMVKLNNQLLEKSRNTKVKNGKPSQTHLFMNNRKIDEIEEIPNNSKICVAYLHNNLIESIGHLCKLKNLTHLYLQWNKLNDIRNLNNLPHLTHLYLGYNYISCLNGLRNIPKLELLHVQKQRIKNTTGLSFDPETISEISESLLELNVSDNGITTLKDLHPLRNLICLDVRNNLLSNVGDICAAVENWKHLKNLQVDGNLISKRRRYEYEIIPAAPNLSILNDRQVSNGTRVFLQALKKIRNNRQKTEKFTGTPFSSETRSFVHQLPLEFREIVSRSIMHKRKRVEPSRC